MTSNAEYQRNWREKNPEKHRGYQYAWAKNNPEKMTLMRRRARLKKKYGMTLEEFDVMLEQQGGTCALCPRTENLCVDHDHASGLVRGILCKWCNINIAWWNEDPDAFLRIVEYLAEKG